jgi:CRP-like cAMP-binding protein
MDYLFRKIARRDTLTDEERRVLEASVSQVIDLPARKLVVREKVQLEHSNLLLSGFVCRYKDLADGQRQILEIHVPGDFLDMHSFLLKKLEHNVATLTQCRIAYFPHDRLKAISEAHPHLARMLWLGTLMDAAIHREWILSVGRRSAIGRLAHLFAELLVRLQVVGLADDKEYMLPLTQVDLADATGLTSVHVNRMLRELRDTGVMSLRDGRVVIEDVAQLYRIGGFDPAYLYLDKQPR